MYKIQTLNKISESGLALFGDQYQITDALDQADAILVRSAKMQGIELPDTVKAIARAGAGVNNIPVDECAKAGIVVFNTPGANANAVKELVIAGLLLSSRKVVEGINWAKTLKTDIAKEVEKGKGDFQGPEILGKKLGIIGLGAIGVMVANAAQSLGMEVIGYDPYISINAAWGLSRHIKHATSLEEVLSESDYLTIHVPLVDATKYMFNKETFAKMKPGVRILNFSRDTLVNNQDLIEAIKEGQIVKYVTDFPVEEVMDNEAIITLPHLGASTPESEENCAVMAVQQVKEYLESGNIVNSVNFPECSMVWGTDYRVAIIHKNIPAMIGKITAIIADEGINIQDMMNRSKGEWAYTIIDTNTKVSENNIKNIKNIENIVGVRILTK
ncbi:MAG: phosphoglycerate dehydrogenase [Clostridia bacterium]|nr:phosphoglycerate dehydrogenase [Clostridia bacterium]